MRFFSGFGFRGEEVIFSDILEMHKGDYNVAGFSYGAQKALEFALASKSRINELVLLSPAFFQDKNEAFRRAQIESFRRNEKIYMKMFLKKSGFREQWSAFRFGANNDDLEALLWYEFRADKLAKLRAQGVKIHIYLGEKDGIIDAKKAAEFFREFGVVYFMQRRNHFLKDE